jgi:cell volume regulation protein A
MTTGILITVCVLLLAAYLFDITAARTRIPSVILLLALGWGLGQGVAALSIPLPNLEPVLPLLGTVGLIMIVLEGTLELDMAKEKLPMMRRSALVAFFPLVLVALGIAGAMYYLEGVSFLEGLTNALPLAVISSAIAIPTARNLGKMERDFVVFESSLSDIFGVTLFYFVALHDVFGWRTFGNFGLNLLVILLISFIATVLLAFLLSRIQHHVKFAPIIVLIVLIYGVAKVYHLPGLVLIMVFGLFLGNLDQLDKVRWIHRLRPETLEGEVVKMKELVAEGTFLVRSLFFLLFGFQIDAASLVDLRSLLWALGICASIYLVRGVHLRLMGLRLKPLLFIAPRGLVTVLLFLSIPAERSLPQFGKPLVIQVVLITALVMMVGTVLGGERKKEIDKNDAV